MSTAAKDRFNSNIEMLGGVPVHITDNDYRSRLFCWYEYRFMSFLERTRQFAQDYCDAYRWTYGVTTSFDFDLASQEFSKVWKMRQSADSWHMSYPIYLEVCFSLYRSSKHSEKLAVPNDVFAKREATKTWQTRYLEIVKERLHAEYSRLTRMPQYWLVNDRGLHAQVSLRKTLAKLALSSKRFEYFVEHYSVENRIVSAADVLSGLMDEQEKRTIGSIVSDKLRDKRLFINPAPSVSEADMLPSCFGLPRMLRPGQEPCSVCPLNAQCSQFAEDLRTSLSTSSAPA